MSQISKGSSILITTDNYYSSLTDSEAWAMKLGQFYYAHIIYPFDYPRILKPIFIDPSDEFKSKFAIKRYSKDDKKHFPMKTLNLRQDEMYYVNKGKIRLSVVVGYIKSEWVDPSNTENYVLCAPVFGFRNQHGQEFIVKTQAFNYPHLFYLPNDNHGCYKESAVRFELIQPVSRGCLYPYKGALPDKPVILTDEAYWLMMSHLMKFLTGTIINPQLDQDISDYRKLILDGLKAGEVV